MKKQARAPIVATPGFVEPKAKFSHQKANLSSAAQLHRSIGNQALQRRLQPRFHFCRPHDPFVPKVDLKSLAGGGRPLPPQLQALFGPRFGHDFSDVRLHTGTGDAKVAKTVNAASFTYGSDIYFGAGRYRPDTASGKKLLAHELTHVVQQAYSYPRIQRFVACEAEENCPSRVRGEIRRSFTSPMIVAGVSGPLQGLLVANFAVNRASLKSDLSSNPNWSNFLGQMVTNTNIRWEILGFADCLGSSNRNASLRWQRAIAVNNALPRLARNQVDAFRAAPLTDCISANIDEQGRSHNRAALIRQKSATVTFEEEAPITAPRPANPFLDLQIACVIDAGGCATPSQITKMDNDCRPQTGYVGATVTHSDLVCRTPGMGVARSLRLAYPNWLDILPDCPCTSTDAAAAGHFSRDLNPFLRRYHPGADVCYRSDPVASTPGTEHRQQCCYTRAGMLITQGAGAGTPDVWSGFFRHQQIDVHPFDEFNRDYRAYNRFWVPNTGSGCAASDPCINRCEQAFERCGGGPRCLAQRSTCLMQCRPRP